MNKGTAVITGASSGLGASYARFLASFGYDLILVARRRERLESFARALGSRGRTNVEVIVCDLADEAQTENLCKALRERTDITCLVNNAGFGSGGFIAEADGMKQVNMLRVHTVAPYRLIQAILPSMLKRSRGAIINVASLAAFTPMPGAANYNATKSYLVSLSRTLALETTNTGVRVQAFCPGMTHTGFHSTDDFSEFDKGSIPRWMWMSADNAVRISLAQLESGPTVVVPGRANKFLRFISETPILSSFALKIASRFRNK